MSEDAQNVSLLSKYTFKRRLKAHLLNEQVIFWTSCTFYIMLYSF